MKDRDLFCSKPCVINAEKYAVVDLHLHLDGSLSLKSVRELADLQNIPVPSDDGELLAMLQVGKDCRDLNEYLEKFDFPVSLLQTKEALTLAVSNLERELKDLGLLYAEIRFAPQLHTRAGLTQDEAVEAAADGMGKCGFSSNLILCCMRGGDRAQNIETVNAAKKYLGFGVAAVDLAGAEALFPTEDFRELFSLASRLSVPYTVHAGEADGPSSVRTALSFGARRIGHGVRSIEDKELVKRLSEEGIFLELCPTSNLNTNIFASLSDYPIPELLSSGVRITLNSDNMTVSGTDVREEYKKAAKAFGLTDKELKTLTLNSVSASFAGDSIKAYLLSRLEEITE